MNFLKRSALVVVALAILPLTLRAADAPLPNLAAGRTATASSVKGKSNTADKAVDGDAKTRWSANDAKTPAWLMVDLGEARELGGCQINWERKLVYTFVVEGSLDGQNWTLLNDQRGNEETVQDQRLALSGKARYVRITTTILEGGATASINEFQVFALQDVRQLPAEAARGFAGDEPLVDNIALKKPAIASSAEGSDRVAAEANDGSNKTRWCASDLSKPQWWEVDLESLRRVGGLQVRWEKAKAYRFVLEGSADNLEWQVLLDQRANAADQQVQKFTFPPAQARYVRLTVTGVDDEATWASIMEIKLLEAK